MILTTSEAAEELRVTPFAVRKMVERGELVPVLTGSSPLRFHLLDVMDAQERRLTEGERATLDVLAARLLADGG
jgi:excisionase family DNA binding protein